MVTLEIVTGGGFGIGTGGGIHRNTQKSLALRQVCLSRHRQLVCAMRSGHNEPLFIELFKTVSIGLLIFCLERVSELSRTVGT